jgi:hypothetical protein
MGHRRILVGARSRIRQFFDEWVFFRTGAWAERSGWVIAGLASAQAASRSTNIFRA